MRRKVMFRIIEIATLVVVVTFIILIISVQSDTKNLDAVIETTHRKYFLSDDQVSESVLDFRSLVKAKTEFEKTVLVKAGEKVTLPLLMPTSGKYNIVAAYSAPEVNLFENRVDIIIDNQIITSQLPFLWVDDIGEKRTDRYGNEIAPDYYQLGLVYNYLEDISDFSRKPFAFNLKTGENEISIKSHNQDMLIHALYAVAIQDTPSYDEYMISHENKKIYEGNHITIEGENYRAKSDSYIRSRNIPNSTVQPFNPYVKLLNAIDDKSNKTVGQKIVYEVQIPEDGLYYFTFNYSQPLKIGGSSYRTIEIDGKVPYKELRDVGFSHTGIEKYEYFTLGKDKPLGVFLTKGIHTISMKATSEPLNEIYNELLKITNEMNDMGIKIKKIKGSNSDASAGADNNRTWDILQYIPDILDRLEDWEMRLEKTYYTLKLVGGAEPAFASDLMLASQNLKRLRDKPREIPNKMTLLSDDSSSAAQLVSLVLTQVYEQNLSVDRIFLHGKNTDLPSSRKNILSAPILSLKQFIYSFSEIMNESVDINNEDGILTVWVNKPVQYVEVMRDITAQGFTEEKGIEVVFSIMPDEKKITLANSTGSNPDLALGLSYFRPAEFAMRGMAIDLREFDDFLNWYSKDYNIRSLNPMAYENGIYAASETQDFYVLFYRKDILDSLELSVPDTWDDVKAMMPVLHRNAMNFNLTLANNVGYKSFETTGGFIFQNNGDYYSKDGFSANFTDPNTLKGLHEMVELYQIYGLAQNVPNFFNVFRSGAVPIGVSNFSTYIQLQIGAPELNGRWDIALVPGTVQENGKISRYWSADATAAMIFANTKYRDESYEFLKWWLSAETQLKYAVDLQLKYGPDYIWNTANHKALSGMSYPQAHKDIILEQWSWQKEALRHPASYILEREVSNAWISIVTEGEGFQSRIDEGTLNSNREIKRKLTEFGYFDKGGNKIKDYNVTLIEDIIIDMGVKAK